MFAPLGDTSTKDFRRALKGSCPGWGVAEVQVFADYLGFCLSPDAGEQAWNKVVEKYLKRAGVRGVLGLGLHSSTLVYNTSPQS